MIFITGDTHIPLDISKLNSDKFPQQKELTKNDYVIICGDFGGIWYGNEKDNYWLNWLEKKNFTTLFVDGNHENFAALSQYEECSWNGGKVQFIRPSVIHLMRGYVFDLEGINEHREGIFFCSQILASAVSHSLRRVLYADEASECFTPELTITTETRL